MSEFKGRITEISKVKSGTTKKGDGWSSIDVEVTESNPHNIDYPEIAGFSFFKSGEYENLVKEFNYKVGDEVTVSFNFKRQEWEKDGVKKKFYKNDIWRIEKGITAVAEPTKQVEDDNLPF